MVTVEWLAQTVNMMPGNAVLEVHARYNIITLYFESEQSNYTNKKVLSWVASIRTTYILEIFKSAPIMLPLDKSPAVSALHPSVSPYIIPVQGTSKLRSRHHWYGGIVWSDSFSAPDMHIFVGKHMNSEQKRGPNTNSIHTRIKKCKGKPVQTE